MCNKIYTVGYMMGKEDTPFIRLSGNWLKDQGFNVGDKLKYISSKNMIILVKMPNDKTPEDKKQQEIKKLENRLKELRSN